MTSSPAPLWSVEELLEQARQAAASAYCPYSEAAVGCALITASGVLYLGCNVENASYGLTMCAERVAIGKAVTGEGAGMKWTQAAVVAPGHEFPPCGACRQVLAEFAAPDAKVTFLANGQPVTMRIRDLLPAGFDRQHLRA
jgi:cytidine deaminase